MKGAQIIYISHSSAISTANMLDVLRKSPYVGSLAKFKNRQTFSMEPFSSKSCLKKRAPSILTCKAKPNNSIIKCIPDEYTQVEPKYEVLYEM